MLSAGEIALLYDARQVCAASVLQRLVPPGRPCGGGACTNTLADANNCGGCGSRLHGPQQCVSGTLPVTPPGVTLG